MYTNTKSMLLDYKHHVARENGFLSLLCVYIYIYRYIYVSVYIIYICIYYIYKIIQCDKAQQSSSKHLSAEESLSVHTAHTYILNKSRPLLLKQQLSYGRKSTNLHIFSKQNMSNE